MSNRSTERCLRGRLFVDMDELMVFSTVSEGIDPLLLDNHPIAGGNFVPAMLSMSSGSTHCVGISVSPICLTVAEGRTGLLDHGVPFSSCLPTTMR